MTIFLSQLLQVNGFYQANGIARYIPDAYTWYEKWFLKYVASQGQQHRITLYEYYRNSWTFHAKGLWYYPCGSQLPTMTIIGSSNFGTSFILFYSGCNALAAVLFLELSAHAVSWL